MAGSCEHGNATSGSVKCGEFIYYLKDVLFSQDVICSTKLVKAVLLKTASRLPQQRVSESVLQRLRTPVLSNWYSCTLSSVQTSLPKKLDSVIKLLINIVRVVKSRRMRWAGHVARMGEGRGVHRVLVGKPEGKRPLGRPRRRWEDNIKMDLQEVGASCGEWMELAQDRDRWRALVGTVRKLRVPKMRGIS